MTSASERMGTALLAIALVASPLGAQDVPTTLRYQARLVDGGGTPVDQTLDAVFRIYDSPVSGVPLYTEAHTAANPALPPVDVDQGHLSVLLGTEVPIAPSLFTGTDSFWLGVTLGSDSELAPRLLLSGVPFAANAAAAEDVPGRDITPNSVTVNGTSVIDAAGQWVGPAPPGAGSGVYFDASGTWVAPAGARIMFVTLVGGGGGGGHTNDNSHYGGSAGAYAVDVPVHVTGGTTYTVTVGAGGSWIPGSDGTAGGDSSVTGPDIDALVATGGEGGKFSIAPAPAPIVGADTRICFSGDGDPAVDPSNPGWEGASGPFGDGGTQAAPDATGHGAGGAAGRQGINDAGDGAPGFVLVRYH